MIMRKDHVSRQHTKFPFGKYKGYYFKDIPKNYLEWAAKNFLDEKHKPLLTMILEEIGYRHFNNKKR
jgi:uncharacterized protein (DUF3820 family)